MDEHDRTIATPLERLISTIEGALPVRRVADAEEREVKILGVDLEKLQARLAELPNATVFRGTVGRWDIELPGVPEEVTLRYRTKTGERPTLDVKSARLPHPLYKVKREINWEIDGDLPPDEVARRLGATNVEVSEKERVSYRITDGDLEFHLDIDQDNDLGQLVEIEGATDAAIERAIVLLRLEGNAISAAGRSELLRQKQAGKKG